RPQSYQGCPPTAPPMALFRLRKHLDKADATRNVAAEEDAVRVGRIDVDAPRIGFCLRQWELNPFLSLGVEPRNHVDLMLAHPDVIVLLIDNHRIVATGLRRRAVDSHL